MSMMPFDPRVVAFGVLWLALSAVGTAVWWTRRRYAGFGRWLLADLALFLALCLMSLRPNAPDWVSVVCANAILVLASVLLLEGARVYRGLSPHVWPAYFGGLVTIGVLVLFLYGVPSLNARAAVMSAFIAVIFVLTATTLLRGVRPAHTFGLRVTGGAFAVCAATLFARATYCVFGPPLNDLFASTLLNQGFSFATSALMALFPVGFMLLADERVTSDLQNANERVGRAEAEVAHHRETAAALRDSERRFRQLADTAPVMTWVAGPDRGCTYVNRPWLEFTGRCLDAELGDGWASGVHADDITRCLETYNGAFDRRQSFRIEYRLRRHDGTYRWILDHGVPITALDGSFAGYVGSAVDITDQRAAAAALSSLSGRLMEAQEAERAWIARELHEDLAQRAAALAMRLQSMVRVLPSGTPEQSVFQKTTYQAGDLAHDIQHMSSRLHSASLELLGLPEATKSLCAELSQRHDVTINCSQDGVPRLTTNVALCLFRVLQEALNNAIKHANVQHIDVALCGTRTDVQLLVIDRGIGFDLESVSKRPGLGLIGMKERLNLVGGEIHIESKPEAGTTIRARVPLISYRSDEKAL